MRSKAKLAGKRAAGVALAVLLWHSSLAQAKPNWVRLGETPQVEIYADTANLARPPGYVKFWTLVNYKRSQRGGWKSERRLFMFSCKEQTLQWQQSMYYSDIMGEGEFMQARTLNRYGVGDLRLVELDPSTRDPALYPLAVPESKFIRVIKELC